MSLKTVEVELEDGRVSPKGQDVLPSKAKALLTILETTTNGSDDRQPNVGLSRFLSANDFPLTPDQFKAAMEAEQEDLNRCDHAAAEAFGILDKMESND